MTDAGGIRSRASDVAEGFRLWCYVLSLICLFALGILHSLHYILFAISRIRSSVKFRATEYINHQPPTVPVRCRVRIVV